jgi:hypothetical protein
LGRSTWTAAKIHLLSSPCLYLPVCPYFTSPEQLNGLQTKFDIMTVQCHFFDPFQFWLKSDRNNGHLTRLNVRPQGATHLLIQRNEKPSCVASCCVSFSMSICIYIYISVDTTLNKKLST